MPTFTGKTFSSFYKNILSIDQASNTGVDTATRIVQDGDGNNTVLAISDDQVVVQPKDDNTTSTVRVRNEGGDNIFIVDTTNSKVLSGASQVSSTTLFKEMGLYDFSPVAGYHFPLVANSMFIPTGATAFAADQDWGNATDPTTTLDVSGLTAQENAIAVYWYLDNNITLDSVRFMATADGSATLNFHLFAYTLDTSSNHGDLSSGVVHANATVDATATTVKTGVFTLDAADIDSGKVVVGFVENVTDSSDVSVSFNIKYHIR